MYVEYVPNRNSKPTVLLRESWREDGKVRKRTLANLTHWPEAQIQALRQVLQGHTQLDSLKDVASLKDSFQITRSLPHGHVVATWGTLKKIGLDRMVGARRNAKRDRVVALIVARIIDPRSKLATARGLQAETAFSTLGHLLGVEGLKEDHFYEAMDWLVTRQEAIEAKLAKKHLSEGTFILYDVTSSYFEGRHCPLVRFGYNRDGKKGKAQIVFGILCNLEGCPVGVEVFEGNTGDPTTFTAQVQKVRDRFELSRVIWVGDRGMITSARIREDLQDQEGLDWITALRSSSIQSLIRSDQIEPSDLHERGLAEITSPDFPGERLIVCRNPELMDERRRKRNDLLAATDKKLEKIAQATCRSKNSLRGQDEIALRVGKVLASSKVAKHFSTSITDDSFTYERLEEKIAREAALDGIYIVRTSVAQERLSSESTVEVYKRLSVVERAFRCVKTVDLKVRPVYHRLAHRVRAHVFLCVLAYYVEWHMRQRLAPLLFEDHDPESARASRDSIVQPAKRSQAALRKIQSKRTDEGMPVHSFQTLLEDLQTLTKNTIQPLTTSQQAFEMMATPTPLQKRAFSLLGVTP